MRAPVVTAVVVMLVSASAVHSHHSTTPVYASDRIVTKTGVVSSFRLVNPHTMLTLDVAEEDSTIVKWIVEFDGRLNLTRFGWTDETLKTGDVITVTGNPTHNDSPRIFFMELERSDGTRLRRPMVDQLIGTLEDARRQRAEGRRQ